MKFDISPKSTTCDLALVSENIVCYLSEVHHHLWPLLVVDSTVFLLQEGFRIDFLMLLGYANAPFPHPIPNINFKKIFLY